MLISECGKREVQNAFRKQWKKYLSVSVYGKRKTENGIGKKTVSQTVNCAYNCPVHNTRGNYALKLSNGSYEFILENLVYNCPNLLVELQFSA